MSQKETKAQDRGKKYHIELSRTSICLWSLGLFFLLAWIFTLGVLAGRGLLPGGLKTLAELKPQIAKIQEMIGKKDSSELDTIKGLHKDPEFGFYDELSVKREEPINEHRFSEKKQKRPLKKAGPTLGSKGQGDYVVQVASLDNAASAAKMVSRLTDRGYPAYFSKALVNGRTYYRVRCGMFRTKEEATRIRNRLEKSEGLNGFIRKVNGK